MQAQEDLFTANLKFVVSIAKRYIGRGMLFLDLIREGNLGLMEAVERFDYRKGKHCLKPYAWWWIFGGITRSIAKTDHIIYMPTDRLGEIKKLTRVQEKLFQKSRREPTPEEIANKMDTTVYHVLEIMKIAQEPVSWETPINDDEGFVLGDLIEDYDAPIPFEIAADSILKENLVEVLNTLTYREKHVLMLRFGLKDGKSRTLEEVGKNFQLTGERIRQIESKALRKLLHPNRSKKVKRFFGLITMNDGFINLNKSANMTSHDAVNFLRKIFHTRKVGHGGTLDPMATGILPVAINQATKFIEYLADCDKTYRAEIFFGIETDSGDITGKIIREENFSMPNLEELQAATKKFIGEIEQTPPKFSAIKINGRKAYDMARKNLEFEMPRRLVKINKFEILNVDENILTVEVDCAKGTYIRSLAADFGAKLKIPATLKSLQRVRVGKFFIENSATIDELKVDGEKFLMPIESCLDFEKFNLPNHRVKAYLNGLPTNIFSENKLVKVYADEKFLGVGKIENGELRSTKILT